MYSFMYLCDSNAFFGIFSLKNTRSSLSKFILFTFIVYDRVFSTDLSYDFFYNLLLPIIFYHCKFFQETYLISNFIINLEDYNIFKYNKYFSNNFLYFKIYKFLNFKYNI